MAQDLGSKDIDTQIAEKVMGLIPCDKWKPASMGIAGGMVMMNDHKVCRHKECYPSVPDLQWPGNGPRPYSTDIKAAWDIVEKLSLAFEIKYFPLEIKFPFVAVVWGPSGWGTMTKADTAPMAICLAALKAVRSMTK